MTAHNFRDLTGQTFGYLSVLRRVENNKDGRARFRCKCIACGRKDYDVLGKHLMRGGTLSSGCRQHVRMEPKHARTP
jgi:hypothetical protein